MELEILDAALERHDPAVEQGFWSDDLAAEVVDDEGAAERLDVERRFVELRQHIETQVEHVERQLAAGNDERALAGDPAAVEVLAPYAAGFKRALRLVIDAFVNAGVEHLDDLAFHLETIRNVDHIIEDAADLLGD